MGRVICRREGERERGSSFERRGEGFDDFGDCAEYRARTIEFQMGRARARVELVS